MSSVGMLAFILMVLMALVVFHVPVKGSFGALALGALLYVFSTCGFGQLVSTFTRTQVAAVFATTVFAIIPTVNFSGLLVPVSSLTGPGRVIGLMFPSAWFQPISVGTFTKGLSYSDLWFNALVLAVFAVGYFIAAHILLQKQEKLRCQRASQAADSREQPDNACRDEGEAARRVIGSPSCGCTSPTSTG